MMTEGTSFEAFFSMQSNLDIIAEKFRFKHLFFFYLNTIILMKRPLGCEFFCFVLFLPEIFRCAFFLG